MDAPKTTYLLAVMPFLLRGEKGTLKVQQDKLVEEAAEAFSAAEAWRGRPDDAHHRLLALHECCDTIQAACNLMAAVGASAQDVDDAMRSVHESNARRGRYEDD